MKFTCNWLKQYVDFDWSPQELAEKADATRQFGMFRLVGALSFGGWTPVLPEFLASRASRSKAVSSHRTP